MKPEPLQDHDDVQEGLLTSQSLEPESLAAELPPEPVDTATPERPKKRRHWKNVILDDDEYVEMIIYTSFLAEFVAWFSLACVVIFVVQLVFPLRWGFFGVMVVSAGMLAHWWYTRRSAWAITNRRVISRLGFLSKRGTSVSYNRVTDIDVIRPFLCEFFGTGKINVNTAAGSGDNLEIYEQRQPEKVESIIRTFAAKMNSSPTETATGHDDDNDLMVADPRSTQERTMKRTHSDSEPNPYQSGIRNVNTTAFVTSEDTANSHNSARWFLDHVWTPNDPETYVQLRRVHYRYLSQDNPQRADGQPYTNSLRDWRYLQRAALEASRLGWLGMFVANTAPSAHYYPLGEASDGLQIWAAGHDLDDIVLPLCQRLELPYLSYASALAWPSLLRFAHKTCKPHANIIYLSNYDPWLEPIPTKHLEKQLSAIKVKLSIAKLALSGKQVEHHGLAPVPGYEATLPSQASQQCVELASLEGVRPGELARLIESAVDRYRQLAASQSMSV
ncbi:MAG: PH domain-containing protein [Deinococcota bacterium]